MCVALSAVVAGWLVSNSGVPLPAADSPKAILNWQRTGEVFATIMSLSMLIERALSPIFESSWYIRRLQAKELKEIIAVVVATVTCWVWRFDAVSMLVLAEKTNAFGYFVTGAIVAGGSKGSIRLFREALGIKSGARREYEELKRAATAPVSAPRATMVE